MNVDGEKILYNDSSSNKRNKSKDVNDNANKITKRRIIIIIIVIVIMMMIKTIMIIIMMIIII